MYLIDDLYKNYQKILQLELVSGGTGMQRRIIKPEAHRPGLSLSGFLKNFVKERILIFGNAEVLYLKDLDSQQRSERLRAIFTTKLPAVFVAGKFSIPKEMIQLCEEQKIPLFRSQLATVDLMNKLSLILTDAFSPSTTCHGTFIEVFGIGVLIQGDSSIGKSEAALGLIERGHRLISDDIVRLKLKKESYLEGTGPELTRHMMEIRGIGIINVAHLYGTVCVCDVKSLDIIVKLEAWDDATFYDRVGLDEKYCNLLGMNLPYYILPVKPGRDVVLLIETIVLHHRLKGMGLHSAREFNAKLLETIAKKQSEQRKRKKTKIESKSKS